MEEFRNRTISQKVEKSIICAPEGNVSELKQKARAKSGREKERKNKITKKKTCRDWYNGTIHGIGLFLFRYML